MTITKTQAGQPVQWASSHCSQCSSCQLKPEQESSGYKQQQSLEKANLCCNQHQMNPTGGMAQTSHRTFSLIHQRTRKVITRSCAVPTKIRVYSSNEHWLSLCESSELRPYGSRNQQGLMCREKAGESNVAPTESTKWHIALGMLICELCFSQVFWILQQAATRAAGTNSTASLQTSLQSPYSWIYFRLLLSHLIQTGKKSSICSAGAFEVLETSLWW